MLLCSSIRRAKKLQAADIETFLKKELKKKFVESCHANTCAQTLIHRNKNRKIIYFRRKKLKFSLFLRNFVPEAYASPYANNMIGFNIIERFCHTKKEITLSAFQYPLIIAFKQLWLHLKIYLCFKMANINSNQFKIKYRIEYRKYVICCVDVFITCSNYQLRKTFYDLFVCCYWIHSIGKFSSNK